MYIAATFSKITSYSLRRATTIIMQVVLVRMIKMFLTTACLLCLLLVSVAV